MSEPSVEFSAASHPAPAWGADAEPLDPNWTPQQEAGYWAPPPPNGAPAVGPVEAVAADVPARSVRRWRLAPHSLTGRLVAGVVTLVVFLVLATGICTYVALRSFLLNRLDQQVASAASGQLDVLFSPSFRPSVSGVQAPQTVWAT